MNQASGTRRPASGYTLMEVIASVVVIGIAFVVLAQGLASASHAQSVSEATTRALMVATNQMAEVEAGNISLEMQSTETVEGERRDYEVTITPQLTTHEELYLVTVEVKWNTAGKEHSMALDRYIHKGMRAQ